MKLDFSIPVAANKILTFCFVKNPEMAGIVDSFVLVVLGCCFFVFCSLRLNVND